MSNPTLAASGIADIDSVLDALPANIALLDRNGTIVSVNAAWRAYGEAHGWTDPSFGVGQNYLAACTTGSLGADDLDRGGADDLDRGGEALLDGETSIGTIRQGLSEVLAGQRPSFSMEYPCHGPRERRWYRFTATPRADGGAVVMHVDVTDRHLAGEILRRTDARFRDLVGNIQDYMIVMLDPVGAIQSWNAGARSLTGYEEAEVIGRGFEIFFPESQRAAGEPAALLRKVAEEGRSAYEGRRIRKDGTVYWSDCHLTALWSEAGDLQGFAKITRDATAKWAATHSLRVGKDAAERANRAKDQFLATISHEIRTPMSGVLGLLDLLTEEDLTPRQLYLSETAKESALALVRLLDDLVDIDSIERGRITLISEMFSICELVHSVARTMSPRAEERGLRIDVDGPDQRAELLLGDDRRVRQILTNLIGNALKFTDVGGVSVTVSQRPRSDERVEVEIRVKDTGIGIPDGERHQIFRRYGQVLSPETVGRRGAGLGLLVTKQIVERMGGEIGFTSAVGVGTEFVVTIPFRSAANGLEEEPRVTDFARGRAAAGRAHTRAGAGAGAGVKSLSILVAEDDLVNQEVCQAILEGLGHSVRVVRGGRQAVEFAERFAFDFILLDLHMPGMDGFEAARVILSSGGPNALVPIVALTADVTGVTRARAFEAGFVEVLSKPLRRLTFSDILDRVGCGAGPRREIPRTNPEPAQAELVEPVVARDLCDSVGTDGYAAIVGRFARQAAEEAEEIAQSIRSGRMTAGAPVVHALAGTAANVGAAEVFRLARTIGSALRAGHADAALTAVEALPGAISRFERVVTSSNGP